MATKYITVKGAGLSSATPFYIGVPQHVRTLTTREFYALGGERTGYTPTSIRAAFMALRETICGNSNMGRASLIDGVTAFRTYPKGAFETMNGPWVKGRNVLMVESVEIDPFKSALADMTPVNNTEGAKPRINTVLDETTLEYDIITGTHVFSIAGSDLGPDVVKSDEYVALVDENGSEARCTTDYSDLQNVKAHLVSAVEPGEYTLTVYTRSGLGEEFGVRKATRKVTVK